MATIPTLIVGPAIVAAGLAYRYGRFDDDRDQRDTWGLTTPGFRARRMSDMTAGGGEAAGYPEPGMRTTRSASISGGGGKAAGAKFESDFQPQVPSERQRTDSFVPTNMLASSSATSASGNSGGSGSSGGGWSSQQQQQQQQNLQQSQQPKQSIYDKISDRRVAETLAERENPFPRTTNELENRSWAFRALHKVSGDLGSIEHKDSPVQKERLVFPEEASSSSNAGAARGMQGEGGKQGVNVLGSNKLFGNVAPDNNDQLKQSEGWTTAGGLDAPGTRSTTKIEPSENVVGSTVHRASRAADDVNRLGVKTVDANQAGLDVTGEGNAKSRDSSSLPSSENGKPEARSGGGGGGWFWGSSNKDNNTRDAAKKAASESRGWFWNKKSDADKAISDTADSAKEAADNARGWLGNKKQEADKSVSDTVESAKEAAENTRGWLSDKKQGADRAVSDTVDSAKNWAQSASDSAKETADNTRGWFWNKKQDADKAVGDTVDSAKEAVDNTRGWLGNKKQEADNAVSDTIDSAKEKADNTRGWFWNKKQDADKAVSDTVGSAKDSLNTAATESRDWARSKKDNAVDAVEHEWDWATGKADDMGRSTRNAVDSAADASKSWMWSQKSKADNAVANAADTVGDSAAAARDRAANKAGDTAGNAGGSEQGKKQQRRDSLMSPLKDTTTTGTSVGSDNSVLDALDSKFDDARTALRNTSEDLRTMASDASVAASDKLKDAVETVRFHPTNEGIVRERIVRGRGENGEDVAMRFVEIDSGIPQLSNSVREMSATTAPATSGVSVGRR
ncbi:hypothetical protein IWW48_003622 [Coemansia sp. RSA 1200]|nr:hypothetical protein IWW48_003622 [Coemansia sp. RSA 1200]